MLVLKEVLDTYFRTQNPTFGRVKSKAYQKVNRPSHVKPAASAGTKTHGYIAKPFIGYHFREMIADNPAKSESQTHTGSPRPTGMHTCPGVQHSYAGSIDIASRPSRKARQADVQG